jgi:hypothetical protein
MRNPHKSGRADIVTCRDWRESILHTFWVYGHTGSDCGSSFGTRTVQSARPQRSLPTARGGSCYQTVDVPDSGATLTILGGHFALEYALAQQSMQISYP